MPNFGRRGFAGALLFWLTPAASVAGGLALAPLLALCSAIGAPWKLKRPPLATVLLLAAAVWAAITLLWSPEQRPEQALKIVLVTLSGTALAAGISGADSRAKSWVRASLIAGALILAALLLIEWAFDMPFNRTAQPLAATGVLQRNPGKGVVVLETVGFAALAAALGLKKPARWIVGGVLLAAMAWLAPQFSFEANAIAFAVGLLALGLGYVAPKLGPKLVGCVWGAWLVSAPWAMQALSQPVRELAQAAPLSWGMRLLIWDYAAARAAEKPLFGWGLDASRNFRDMRELGGYEFASIPLHPHSFSLQVWLEAGAVGALLLAGAFVAAGFAAARWCAGARLPAAAATACFASLGMLWNISYGAWQEWYMALPFIAAAGILTLRRDGAREANAA